MYRAWSRILVLGTLTGALLFPGCDTTTTPPPQAEILAPPDSGSDELLRRVTQTLLRPVVPVLRGVGRITDGVVSGVVSVAGGVLELDGHSLTVPAGAVSMPTLFTLTVVPGDDIVVDLRAIDVATGLDVGGRGFALPVQLALSYAGSTVSDPSRLVIVRILAGGDEVLPTTVDTTRRVAWTDLDHFSRYGLCER